MSDRSRFEILTQIGYGQFSNVYKAKWVNAPVECSAEEQADLLQHYSPSTDQNQMSVSSENQLPVEFNVFSSDSQQTQPVLIGSNKCQAKTPESTCDRYVALKRIKFYDIPDSKKRMDCIQEVKLLQQLKHPNIINYNISFIYKNELFIVLELANGGDLSKLITYFYRRKQLLSERSILKYFTQVCSAVKYIHSKRILHRDIKPANIFMTSNGCVKLGDFGLGRFFSQNTRDAHTYVGTFYYMSPERICETGYGFSSDVWSLGCVLYELITLISPFSLLNIEQPCQNLPPTPSDQPMHQHQQQQLQLLYEQQNRHNLKLLMERIIRAEYPSLAPYTDISLRLRQLTMECLNPNPEARPNMEYICAVVGEAHRIQQLTPVQPSNTNRKTA